MAESLAPPLSRWRYGMHPHATEMRIRSLGRVYLQLGEAFRLEMASADEGGEDIVHLQYYIATELGPWALWLSRAREDVAECETSLRELTAPFAEGRTPPVMGLLWDCRPGPRQLMWLFGRPCPSWLRACLDGGTRQGVSPCRRRIR